MPRLRILPGYAVGATSIEDALRNWTSPTNAQALAILSATGEPSGLDEATARGVDENVSVRYFGPTGILTRMRLLAAGWVKPGDVFAKVDAPWWQQKYSYPLASVLKNMPAAAHAALHPTELDEALARGDADALGHELQSVDAELTTMKAAGLDQHPPFLIPAGAGLPPVNAKADLAPFLCKDKATGKYRLRRPGESYENCEPTTVQDPISKGLGWVWILGFLFLAFRKERRSKR